MTTDYCPASREYPAAFLRCNLPAGHAGLHDDGIHVPWADDTTTPGPGRLTLAAYCLNGSEQAWERIREQFTERLRPEVGDRAADLTEVVVYALHDLLVDWKERDA